LQKELRILNKEWAAIVSLKLNPLSRLRPLVIWPIEFVIMQI
jgi:hypothetical protein